MAKRYWELMFGDVLEFVHFLNDFRKVERVMWMRGVDGRERNGEHSFQLAMLAWFVNERCGLGLNQESIIRYCLVHDLPETYAGDACWSPTAGIPTPPMEGKEERERDARRRIAREWGQRFPALIQYMEKYHLQSDEESRFVYALDKLISDLNVFDQGGTTNRRLGITREMRDQYKTPRASKHPVVGALFAEMSKRFDEHPEYFIRLPEKSTTTPA